MDTQLSEMKKNQSSKQSRKSFIKRNTQSSSKFQMIFHNSTQFKIQQSIEVI